MFFVLFVLFGVLGYFLLTRLLPRFLAWSFKRKYRLDVDIGRIGIGFWYFTLRDVKLMKNHVSVHIDEIWFRSSFFSSEVAKLLLLVIKDVRIDIKPRIEDDVGFQTQRDFHNQKIPPAVIKFVQFMAVHVYNISVMFLRAESPEWLIHASAGEVNLDGSIIHNARTLLVNMSVTATTAKFLKHAVESDPQPCLVELAFGINMEATVIAQGPLSVEKLYIGMENPQAVVHDAIYGFAQRTKRATIRTRPLTTFNFQNYLPIIPKNVSVKIENSVLNGMRGDSKIDFSAALKSLLINTQVNQSTSLKPSKDPLSPQIFLSFQMEHFEVKCNKKLVVEMTKLSIDGNYEENLLNIYFTLTKLTLIYEHLFMKPWVVNNFLRAKEEAPVADGLLLRQTSWLDHFCDTCQVSGNVELWKVCVWGHLPDQVASIGFEHTKFNLEKTQDLRSYRYDTLLGRLLFGKRHWTLELFVESFWCRMGPSLLNTDVGMLKKYHTWGTPLYIGMVLIKARSQAMEIRINSMIDFFRTEYSPQFAASLLQFVKCGREYQVNRIAKRREERETKKTSVLAYTATLACSNSNLYWLGENNICLMLRIDSVNIDYHKGKIDWMFEGATFTSLKPAQFQHSCVRSEEIKLTCAHVKNARINYMTQKRELSLKLQESVKLKWSTNLHLKIKTLYEEFSVFLRSLKSPGSVQQEQPSLNWVVKVNGDFQLWIVLSKAHEAYFVARELAIGKNQIYTGLETELLKIAVDNAEIFTFTKFEIRRNNDDVLVREERKRADGLSLPQNLVWFTTIDSFKACFPFKHNYAEAIQGEFVSTWKWLKQTHRKNQQRVELGPLPSDIHIEIGQFLFEMSDDPFEVKLRDNFVLLEDEYKESLKRKTMLDAKLEALSQTHLLSKSHDKVEELYQGLCKKNVEIYIQRSKQMKRQSPARTRLFAWTVSDLQIIALADPVLHGKHNVVNVMTAINPESPWPEEGLEFSTLWCRSVFASFKKWEFQLRDFPQPLMYITDMQIFGIVVGAEPMAPKSARRTVFVDLGAPWGQATVERSMTSLKFYHDLNCRVDKLRYAFGPCWEPVIAQCNLSFEKIVPPSRDPSPALPWWDKMRLLFHGRLTMYTKQLTMLLHASLDPYNTTEEMELTWEEVAMDWTNGKFVFQGNFDVYVRTASKYDDCRLLHLPFLKLTVKLTWKCLSNRNDHHVVMPRAPDKLPEFSSNQEYDSFRAFRSQNLDVNIALETKAGSAELGCPSALLYGSTLRWFENLKLILSGVTRPTRRGAVFNNLRAKKKQLSRHYRNVQVWIGVHCFQVNYWMSFAMQRGFDLVGGRVTFNSEHVLSLSSIDDGLLHRARSEWSVSYMNCDLNDAEIWLKSALQGTGESDSELLRQPVEKCYCLSVAKVTYGRETVVSRQNATVEARDTPTHRLVVYDLKGAWTKSNRDVAFALFDTFIKSKQLKKNLSTEALKGFRGETSTKTRPSKSTTATTDAHAKPPETLLTSTPSVVLTTSPLSSAGTAASMLQQLIAEVELKPVVFSDDLSDQTTGQRLQGLQACQEDDVTYKNWLISLINSQVLLKGCETKGYVIMSAAKAEILQRVHNPVWKDRTLVSKTTWVGSLECMQYYATVAAGENDAVNENIMWLTVDNIQEKEQVVEPPDVSQLVGSGQSVGGVVTETVGASCIDPGEDGPVQLQRIVSRCKCEFFYAAYGDTNIDPSTLEEVPPQPIDDVGLWEKKELAVDAFTLMHHDLDVCTNSLQYAMILDIVNHLLLNVETQRKESYERLQRMRFELALHSSGDERKPIQDLQNQVRSTVAKLRRLEKQTYLVQKAMADSGPDEDSVLLDELKNLKGDVDECKELLSAQSEELDVMLSCYKESQLSANQKLATMKGDKSVTTVRANEIVFKHAKWRLTEADGQLGISDLILSNFLYTKNSKSDDAVEHLLELGYIHMINLLPNQIYSEVLSPTEIQSNMPVDRKTAVRVFCREKAPVGGLSVKEHFEINVVPMTIGLTKKFYNTMINFCFPGRDPDTIEGDEDVEPADKGTKKVKNSSKKPKDTNFYVKIEAKDDVEKMKERAEKNKIFIYIKIPEVPVRVSYKGNKEKNVEDMRDFRIVIPTLEYHNVTWTWLDLLLAMKTDCRKVILTQAIKQKLTIKGKRNGAEEGPTPAEEDKARILFGARAMPVPSASKSSKKGVLKLAR